MHRSTTLAGRIGAGVHWRFDRAAGRSRRATRRATAGMRLRPTFLVIGAQKSGTTSLHGYLRDNPAVLTASVKEVQYFTKEYRRGEHWYLSHFPLALRGMTTRRRAGGTVHVGEATAAYLFDPRVPLRVHAFQPAMKLIAVLRDPIERAYSHYQMEVRWGREACSFEDALRREETELPRDLERIANDPLDPDSGLACSYAARGRYAEQLERWLTLFPRDQLLALVSEELLTDPAAAMTQVARFLGIPNAESDHYPLRGVREYPPLDPAIRERLALAFEPENRRLEQLLGRTLPWSSPMPTRSAPEWSASG